MKGKTITFYTAAIEAGKVPPVGSLNALEPSSPYVLLMAKKAIAVQ